MLKAITIAALIAVIGIALVTVGQRPGKAADTTGLERAVLAGGCFWCMEPPFEKMEGVTEVVSGYTGGHVKAPTYKQVSSGSTGHVEAVEVFFDPAKVSYKEILEVFWRQIDPTDAGGQFVDRGGQYRSAIFYLDEDQKKIAMDSKAALEASGRFDKPIVTEILPAKAFYRAEEYHQDYYKKNPIRYKYYRWGSGRDQFLKRVWGDEPAEKSHKEAGNMDKAVKGKYSKPSDEVLKRTLTPIQYEVTQEDSTEPAYRNEYWDNKREGIYVDVVSGEPLFSSKHKYDSGTGWPSFSQPLVPENIVEREDRTLWMVRTEVRSRYGDSHLGHVFSDGPKPTGLRYCMNSAALRFVPKEELKKEGYDEFLDLF